MMNAEKNSVCRQAGFILFSVLESLGLRQKQNIMTKMKTLVISIFTLSTVLAIGQSSKVTSAYYALQDGKLDEAVEYIEPAITNEKSMVKEKTWRYRGAIYMAIYETEEEAYKTLVNDPLHIAYESFTKANELDTKDSYKNENQLQLGRIQILSLNEGNTAFGNKDYNSAIKMYGRSMAIAEDFNAVDTNAVYNTALAAEMKDDNALAIEMYQKCIAIQYDAAVVYRSLAQQQLKTGDVEGFAATLKQGRARYPEDQEMLTDEINYYLGEGKYDEAEASIKEAIALAPSAILWSALGDIYDGRANPVSGEKEPSEEDFTKYSLEAEQAYIESVKLDPENFNAHFNLGVTFYNRGAHMNEVIKEITDDRKYMAAKKEVDDTFAGAIPHFERAHELNPEDQQTMAQLATLYARGGETEKWEAMKAKMD